MMIRARIKEVTGLNASAGISYCKFLAKDGERPQQAERTGGDPAEGGAGLGGQSAGPRSSMASDRRRPRRLERLGIVTGADLREKPLAFLQQHFGGSPGAGITGSHAGSTNDRFSPTAPENPSAPKTPSQSDLFDLDAARAELVPLAEKVWRHCEAKELSGANGDVEGEVRRFPADHPQQNAAEPHWRCG